jgi:hypothetical protein
MPLPDPIIAVLADFRPLFTAPTWRKLILRNPPQTTGCATPGREVGFFLRSVATHRSSSNVFTSFDGFPVVR